MGEAISCRSLKQKQSQKSSLEPAQTLTLSTIRTIPRMATGLS